MGGTAARESSRRCPAPRASAPGTMAPSRTPPNTRRWIFHCIRHLHFLDGRATMASIGAPSRASPLGGRISGRIAKGRGRRCLRVPRSLDDAPRHMAGVRSTLGLRVSRSLEQRMSAWGVCWSGHNPNPVAPTSGVWHYAARPRTLLRCPAALHVSRCPPL